MPLCGTARSTALPPFLKGTCSDATVQQDLSLDRLVAEAQGAGLSTRILTAMILVRVHGLLCLLLLCTRCSHGAHRSK